MAGRLLTSILYVAGLALFYIGVGRFVRYLGRNNPKVLLYHDCAPHETTYTAGLNCTTPPTTFDRHLDYICRHHHVVDLNDIAAGTAPSSSVAITFDDGYQSVYEHAFPLLVKRHLPATIYLISDVIENEDMVWVNELNHGLRTAPHAAFEIVGLFFPGAPKKGVADVIDYCRLNYDSEQMCSLLMSLRSALKHTLNRHASEARLYLGWKEIEEMGRCGISFGNHTKTHPNLERLSKEVQSEEIKGAQEVLSKRISDVRSFAYPFGHHSAETAQTAFESGLQTVVEVGGYNQPVVPLGVGRVHLSDESVAGLFARMEIVEPLKGVLRAAVRKRSTSESKLSATRGQ